MFDPLALRVYSYQGRKKSDGSWLEETMLRVCGGWTWSDAAEIIKRLRSENPDCEFRFVRNYFIPASGEDLHVPEEEIPTLAGIRLSTLWGWQRRGPWQKDDWFGSYVRFDVGVTREDVERFCTEQNALSKEGYVCRAIRVDREIVEG